MDTAIYLGTVSSLVSSAGGPGEGRGRGKGRGTGEERKEREGHLLIY